MMILNTYSVFMKINNKVANNIGINFLKSLTTYFLNKTVFIFVNLVIITGYIFTMNLRDIPSESDSLSCQLSEIIFKKWVYLPSEIKILIIEKLVDKLVVTRKSGNALNRQIAQLKTVNQQFNQFFSSILNCSYILKLYEDIKQNTSYPISPISLYRILLNQNPNKEFVDKLKIKNCQTCQNNQVDFLVSVSKNVESGLETVETDCIKLIEAARNAYERELITLIAKGVDVDYKNADGDCALFYAALRGDLKQIEIMIKSGANLNSQNNFGETSLISVCRSGNLTIAKLLVDAGANLNLQTHKGDSALIWAVRKNHSTVVKLLVDAGADLNLQNKNGDSALIVGTYADNVESVKILLASGASKTLSNNENKGYDAYLEHAINITANLNLPDENL